MRKNKHAFGHVFCGSNSTQASPSACWILETFKNISRQGRSLANGSDMFDPTIQMRIHAGHQHGKHTQSQHTSTHNTHTRQDNVHQEIGSWIFQCWPGSGSRKLPVISEERDKCANTMMTTHCNPHDPCQHQQRVF